MTTAMTTTTTTTTMSKTKTEPTPKNENKRANERTRCETFWVRKLSFVWRCARVTFYYILQRVKTRTGAIQCRIDPFILCSGFSYYVWVRLSVCIALYAIWTSVGLAIWTVTRICTVSLSLFLLAQSHFLFLYLFIYLVPSLSCEAVSAHSVCAHGVSHLTNADLCWYRWSFVAIRYGI